MWRGKSSCAVVGPVSAALLMSLGAHAQERTANLGEWQFSVTPYLWGAAIDGETQIGSGPKVDISANLGDILDDLDIAVMGIAEARRDRFSLFGDVVYVSLSSTETLPGPLFSSAKVETDSFFATLGAGYAAYATDAATVDVLVAGRYWSQDTTIDLRPGALPGRTLDTGEDWFDPLVGGGIRYSWPSGVFVASRALIGGLGIGSDFVFDGVASVGYAFNDTIAASLGFRWLSVDYDDGDFLYDVDQYGPIAGLRISF